MAPSFNVTLRPKQLVSCLGPTGSWPSAGCSSWGQEFFTPLGKYQGAWLLDCVEYDYFYQRLKTTFQRGCTTLRSHKQQRSVFLAPTARIFFSGRWLWGCAHSVLDPVLDYALGSEPHIPCLNPHELAFRVTVCSHRSGLWSVKNVSVNLRGRWWVAVYGGRLHVVGQNGV